MTNWANPEIDQATLEWWVDYSQQLTKITESIKELSDQTNDNDEHAKEELQTILTDEFITNFKDYLDGNPTELATLQENLITILNSYSWDKTDKAYSSLKNLANKIWIKEVNWIWAKESQEDSDKLPEKPTLNFNWELKWIKPGEAGKEQTGNTGLFDWLKRDAPAEDENLEDDVNLYKTMQTINSQLYRVWILLSDDKLKSDADLIKVKECLELAQTVINYATPENVRILQTFIAENLTKQEDKEAFDKRSKKNGKYDGKFWKGTLKWANIILNKNNKYITQMEDYLKELNNKEKLDNVAPKSNPTIKKWEDIEAKTLLNNVPEGADVDFLNDDEKAKLNQSGEQKIKIKVDYDGKTKIVEVTVNVSDNVTQSDNNTNRSNNNTDNLDTPPTSTTPLTIKEGDGENNEKTYQVVENSSTIARNANVPWATFYLATDYEPKQPGEGEDRECQPVPEWTNDYSCIMKLWVNLYKVDICKWYLCPVATKLVKRFNGEYEEDKWGVLFMNNPSCMKYLENKLPEQIQNNCTIWWSERLSDYTLQSYGRKLTIEPMTIAWDWISRKEDNPNNYLTNSLAFLNLTNYIRLEWDNHNRPDPDVNRKVDKFKRIKDGKNKLGIDRSQFWLANATEQELAKFKKYNNWEEWEDDWDKKRKNKVYQKIRIR